MIIFGKGVNPQEIRHRLPWACLQSEQVTADTSR